MSRLYIGDVLEVIIDKHQNKGYLIYLAKHIPIGFKMFGLYAVNPTVHGCNIGEIENKKIISTIMIFEDKFWRKIGKLKVKDFVWPDQYERDLDDNNKYIIYHWGDGEERRIIKIVEKESDLGLAQIGSTFFPAGALKFYRDKLRELGLYNIPEDESLDDINKEDDFDGLYGDVYYSTKENLAKIKTNILIQMKKEYQQELIFPDTALQFYMGVLKAQIEEHCVDDEVVKSYRMLVNQEKDYLSKEEWLNEQVKKLDNELKEINR